MPTTAPPTPASEIESIPAGKAHETLVQRLRVSHAEAIATADALDALQALIKRDDDPSRRAAEAVNAHFEALSMSLHALEAVAVAIARGLDAMRTNNGPRNG